MTATNAARSTSAGAPIVPAAVHNFTRDSSIDANVWDELNQQGDTSNAEIECYEPAQLSLNPTDGLGETE